MLIAARLRGVVAGVHALPHAFHASRHTPSCSKLLSTSGLDSLHHGHNSVACAHLAQVHTSSDAFNCFLGGPFLLLHAETRCQVLSPALCGLGSHHLSDEVACFRRFRDLSEDTANWTALAWWFCTCRYQVLGIFTARWLLWSKSGVHNNRVLHFGGHERGHGAQDLYTVLEWPSGVPYCCACALSADYSSVRRHSGSDNEVS